MFPIRNKKRIFKGSVAVFALIIMFILAIATIGIIATAAIERKVSISTGNSTTAFQIAESGMEKTLQYFKSNFDKTLRDINGSGNCSGGRVTYTSNENVMRFKSNETGNPYIADCNTLISKVKIIKSIGTTKLETRAIEEDVFLGATKLLLHLNGKNSNGDFEDSSFYYNNHNPIDAQGDATDSASERKFGSGASAEFDGNGDYLSAPESDDWDFGSGDFTLDWWEYRTDGADARPTLQRQNTATGYNSFLAGYKSGANLYFYASSNGNSWNIASGKSMGSTTLNDWVHLAIVRKGNTFYTFKNGTQQDTWNSDVAFPNVSANLEIGRYASNYYFEGYIDEFRISKGVARWIGGSNGITYFTPPSAEYWPD